MAAQNLKPSTIVSVDLGTTFSSVAWASTTSPESVNVLRDWPSPEGRVDASRVPTKLTLRGKWGFDIPFDVPQDEVKQWFKLGLYPWVNSAPPLAQAFLMKNTSPEALTKKYLTELLAYAKEQLHSASLPDSYEYVVTVPAVWSDESKEKTRTAFVNSMQEAGLREGTVHLLSEPEAAAIHVLSKWSESSGMAREIIKPGNTFVVCDAGGGTVDLITYTVTNVNPLEVKEASPGGGDMAGSAQLNMRFEAYLETILLRVPEFRAMTDRMRKTAIHKAMTEFETTTKRDFTKNSGTCELPISLPDDDKAGIKDGRLKIKSEHLEAHFKPTVSAIVHQVQQQIWESSAPIKAVVLVGGFSNSLYLYNELRAAVDPRIAFFHPSEPELAVTYGAIKKGLSLADPAGLTKIKVTSRKARHHIGERRDMCFNQKMFASLEHKKYWDGYSGYYRVSAMQWFYKRGDDLDENKSISFPFYYQQLVEKGWFSKLVNTIRMDRNDRAPVLDVDGKVKNLCILSADVSKIPEAERPQKKGKDGELYYILNGDIKVTHRSADMEYVLYLGGKRYDDIKITYDYY
ncbi:hypothetical protein B0T21DRAFT_383316 [Apiosordaria backusii]|uniref:Uncharacterized protein n=1 Tax=Apiosordaria backusii TaxID=314023 RepID=A0AA40EDD5_9PEZI|nr:hypothetical protein B0T21DRAFT_383316 [Apiosordaria backusii]